MCIFSGYMSLEYACFGRVIEKEDVFSFGIIILQVVCAHRNLCFQNSHHMLTMVNLFTWSITNSCFREIFLFEESRLKSLTKLLFLFWALYKVWNVYKKGRLCEAVDPVLEANFQVVEASRLLQIGLVCAQSLMLRPSISVVVKMPTDQHEIPQPT